MCCLSELIDVGQRGDPGQNGFPSADAELRHTVLTYIHERYSELRTAAWLFMHRDSLHGRLAQADCCRFDVQHLTQEPLGRRAHHVPTFERQRQPFAMVVARRRATRASVRRGAGVAYVTLEPRSAPLK